MLTARLDWESQTKILGMELEFGPKMGCKMEFGQNIGWVGPSESHFTFDHVTRSMFSRVFVDLFSYVTATFNVSSPAAELSFTELRLTSMLPQHRVHSSAQQEWCGWVQCSAVKKTRRLLLASCFLGELLSQATFHSSLLSWPSFVYRAYQLPK